VAKEASKIVLTDDNFASIVNAVEEGRGIYDNIKKFVAFLLACNVGEVATMFLATFFFLEPGMIPFLLPIQILWTNLVTDGFPALAIGLERTSSTVMDRPPRDPKESPVTRIALYRILFIAGIMAMGTLSAFQIAYEAAIASNGADQAAAIQNARTVAFCTLVTFQLLFAFSARSETETIWKLGPFSNRKLLAAVGASFVLQLIVVYLPGAGKAFGTVPIGWEEWVLIIAISLIGLIANEIWKFVASANRHKSGRALGH
jgi:Ca2+-transporting ATPase